MTSPNDGPDEQAIRERCDAAKRSGYVNDAVRSSKDIPRLLELLAESRKENERLQGVVERLRDFNKAFIFEVGELEAGRLTSFKTLLVQLQRLLEVATAAGVKHGM